MTKKKIPASGPETTTPVTPGIPVTTGTPKTPTADRIANNDRSSMPDGQRPVRVEAFPADQADRQKEVLDEKKAVTGRISETTRYLGFGLLASFYAIISSSDAFPRTLAATYPLALRLMALAAMLALVFDYLQYVFARAAVQKALNRIDKPFVYNKKWGSIRARQACFWAKQGMALAGCAILIAVVALGT